jgi:hypothetical protein
VKTCAGQSDFVAIDEQVLVVRLAFVSTRSSWKQTAPRHHGAACVPAFGVLLLLTAPPAALAIGLTLMHRLTLEHGTAHHGGRDWRMPGKPLPLRCAIFHRVFPCGGMPRPLSRTSAIMVLSGTNGRPLPPPKRGRTASRCSASCAMRSACWAASPHYGFQLIAHLRDMQMPSVNECCT